jgi:hypothetical protein
MVMANIYARCGNYDKALDELEDLLAQQTPYTVNNFELNGNLEPLRKLPRYQKLLVKYGT